MHCTEMADNLKGVCRLCLSKEGFMFPIFRKDVKSDISFRTKILSCASIEIFADDELPTEICHNCAHQVEKSYYFRNMCENTYANLRPQVSEDDECNTKMMLGGMPENSTVLENQGLAHGEINDSHSYDKNNSALCCPTNKVTKSEENCGEQFICNACSSKFISYNKLIIHFIELHPDITVFSCNKCQLHFSQINDYKLHLNLKHALSCSECDLVFKYQENLKLHLKSHLADVFPCKYCRKKFDKIHELKKHEIIHFEKMCCICSEVFTTVDDYNNHMKKCNGTQCKFCSEVFHVKKDLFEHVNKYHENSSIIKCQRCNTSYTKWVELQNHSCEAVTNKHLVCDYCQQSFTESSLLLSHVSSKHSGESLVCKFCNKSFTLKSALRRHERSHSGLKPYQCKYCPRKFKDNSACIVHIRTHTGEHPFQCQECHKYFKQLANLKMHTYRHHKIDKVLDENSHIIKESQPIYDPFYNSSLINHNSEDGSKSFQAVDPNISSGFGVSNVLLSDNN